MALRGSGIEIIVGIPKKCWLNGAPQPQKEKVKIRRESSFSLNQQSPGAKPLKYQIMIYHFLNDDELKRGLEGEREMERDGK